jgi:hypothetical protein
MPSVHIDHIELVTFGRLVRTAKLRAEYFEFVGDPAAFLSRARAAGLKADLLTFHQPLAETTPRFDYHFEWDTLSVMPISTYEHWCKQQINAKTRNMIRKAEKCGVVIRPTPFNDELVRGIKEIYDESPLRQGKPFLHYRKDFETLKAAHATYLEKSEFIGAYEGNELIGFIKLFHHEGISSLMQIIAKVGSRNKAPTNALIAKAVEICAARGIPRLHYGVWSRRTLGEFKKHHAFEPYRIPRYFVPLTTRGRLCLALKLHRGLLERLPGTWQDRLADMRGNWYARRYRTAVT